MSKRSVESANHDAAPARDSATLAPAQLCSSKTPSRRTRDAQRTDCHEEPASPTSPVVGTAESDAPKAGGKFAAWAAGSLAFLWAPVQRIHNWIMPQGYFDRNKPPAVLISFIVHLAVLIVLALITIGRGHQSGNSADLIAMVGPANENFRSAPIDVLSVAPPAPDVPESDVEFQVPAPMGENLLDSPEMVDRLLVESGEQVARRGLDASTIRQATDIVAAVRFRSTGIEGRSAERRRELAFARGGTPDSEAAVERALAWLAEHQMPSGGWSLLHDRGACDGRCGNPGSPGRYDPAATGLSLLAFLGAGYTHREGKYRDTVRRGIYYLVQILEETPEGGSWMHQSEKGMYNHGIATFAICEAYQLTNDPDLRSIAQSAVAYSVASQHYHGSWGYLPQQPGDLTITGWHVMALKSAQSAGLKLHDNTLLRLQVFLKSQAAPDGVFYGYRGQSPNDVCTAIGNLLQLFLGQSTTDPALLQAARYFHQQGPSSNDIYYDYYATLLLFHMGGGHWREWNPRMRDYLVRTQAQEGHEAGSWYFDHPFGRVGGRLYTTAMAAMTLEVYYRFSPLYQHANEPFEL